MHPRTLVKPQMVQCEHIYNLVVDRVHTATVNGVELILLGHGQTSEDILKHDFLGSDRVIQYLSQ